MRFDFHLHTQYSDGTLPALELIERLQSAEVKIAAITDHDSMKVHQEFNGRQFEGIMILPGVEINTNATGETLHILGFGRKLLFSAGFQEKLEFFRQSRHRRARAIVEKLSTLGVDISMADVESHARDAIGRPNIADALRSKGVVKTREEAFTRFLLKGKPGYVPPMGPDPQQAITAIVEAGGLAVLAHPGIARIDDRKLAELVAYGLGGIEVYYPLHNEQQIRNFLSSARKYGLWATCGSDYHGPESGREELVPFDFEEREWKKFIETISS